MAGGGNIDEYISRTTASVQHGASGVLAILLGIAIAFVIAMLTHSPILFFVLSAGVLAVARIVHRKRAEATESRRTEQLAKFRENKTKRNDPDERIPT